MTIQKIHQLTGHRAGIYTLASGGHARQVLSGAGDGWVVAWDLDDPETGKLLARVEVQIFALLYLPERRTAVVGNMNGGVHWVDVDQPDRTRNIQHHRKGVFAFLRQADTLLSAGGGGLITRWSVDERRALESFQVSHQSIRSLALHPDGSELAVGSSDNAIYLLDAQTLSLRARLPQAHENSVFAVAYHPEAPLLLSGGRDARLKVWSLEGEPSLISEQPAHWFTINDIAFAPSGKYFATASRDKTVKIWDAHDFSLLKVLEGGRDGGHLNSVNRLYWSDSGRYLLSSSDDRTIIIWSLKED